MKADEVFVRHMLDAINEIHTTLVGLKYEEFVADPFVCMPVSGCLRYWERQQES